MPLKQSINSLKDIKLLLNIAFYTLLAESLVNTYIAIISKSLSMVSFMLDCILSLIVYIFSIITIKIALKKNIYAFPYGTGRLENFSSFLTASLGIPTAFFIFYNSITSIHNPPILINFGITQVLFVIAISRLILVKLIAINIMKKSKNYSPILKTYSVTFSISLVILTISSLSLLLAYFLNKTGNMQWAFAIDIIISIFLGSYMLITSLLLMKENFRSLVDLPLLESDQIHIMKSLSDNFQQYENVGYVYTRMSGSKKIVEIELYFNKNTLITDIKKLQETLFNELNNQIQDLQLKLIPLTI